MDQSAAFYKFFVKSLVPSILHKIGWAGERPFELKDWKKEIQEEDFIIELFVLCQQAKYRNKVSIIFMVMLGLTAKWLSTLNAPGSLF